MIESNYSYLPPELLTKIFTYLPTEDLDNAFHVSQYWRNVATEVAKRRFNIRDNLRQSWLGKLSPLRLKEPIRIPKIDLIRGKILKYDDFTSAHKIRHCKNTLVSATNRCVFKWDLYHHKLIQIGDKYNWINEIHADNYGVFVAAEKNVTLFDINQGSIKYIYPFNHKTIAIDTSNTQLFTSNYTYFQYNSLNVTDIETGKAIQKYENHSSNINRIRSLNESILVGVSYDEIYLWDTKSGNIISSINCRGYCATGLTLTDSKIITSWMKLNQGFNYFLSLWDWRLRKNIKEIRLSDRIECPIVYNDQIFFFTRTDPFVCIYDPKAESIFSLCRSNYWDSMVIFNDKIIGGMTDHPWGLEVIDLDPKNWGKITEFDNEKYPNVKYKLKNDF